MKLSIIIPCYNMSSGNKMAFCLDSVLKQTIDDYEVICVDDCSTDNTLEILTEYQKRFPHRLHVIAHDVNKKQGGARNSGLKIARGEYIGFVDADDFIAPDMYEKLLTKALHTGADCVGCKNFITYKQAFDKGIPTAATPQLDVGVLDTEGRKKILLYGGSVWSKIYKRELIFNYPERVPENVFFEDNCVVPLIYYRVKRFEFVNEPLYYYYQHQVATTQVFSEKKILDRLNSGRMIVKYAKQYGYYEQFFDEIEALFIRIFFLNTLLFMASKMPFSRQCLQMYKKMHKELLAMFPNYLSNPYWKTEFGKKRYLAAKITEISPWAAWYMVSCFTNLKNLVKID